MVVGSDTILEFLIFAVICLWGEWSAWEICSVTCGSGTQERNRSITQEALFGGNVCKGDDRETQSCNSNGCPGMDISKILWQSDLILS